MQLIEKGGKNIQYEKYILDNGLQLILHEEHSNPVVAVAILYHVGSNREVVGKTGFAHFFEHTMFQRSEHLKRNEFFSKINNLGGSFNGGTWEDGTIYYEAVPNDSLEKILWMEADRMGFFINTVNQKGLEREIDVVINEKRQTMDNTPYGFTKYVLINNLYPKEHPYNHTVIGEMDDLKTATIDDAKNFYNQYYSPNNATLVICGDIDTEVVKQWVEKYFGEIKKRPAPAMVVVDVPVLSESKFLYHEDKFANMPELSIVFPCPPMYSKDSYALNILCDILCDSKKSPFYKVIVEDKQLAPSVSIYQNSKEISGEIVIKVRAFPDKSLQDVFEAVNESFERFEQQDITQEDVKRLKNVFLTQFYNGLYSNMNKAFYIAEANTFGGSPNMVDYEVDMINGVSVEDVKNVFDKYVKNKCFVATSFVPAGKANLAVKGSSKAYVNEENVEEQDIQSEEGVIVDEDYEYTASKIDRNIEPELSVLHPVKIPPIWDYKTKNGIKVIGIEDNRLPLVCFSIVIEAGSINDEIGKAGTANITAQLLNEGTKNKSAEELEIAIKNLGAYLNFQGRKEWTSVSGFCLKDNFAELMQLLNEIITLPRWDENEFDRILRQTKSKIIQSQSDPKRIADDTFYNIIYGQNHPIALPNEGDIDTIDNITLEDVKNFYQKYYSPSISKFVVVGDVDKANVLTSIACIEHDWSAFDVQKSYVPSISSIIKDKSTFVEYPGLQQSIIYLGKNSLARTDADYVPAVVANYRLGQSSGSVLFRVLRLEHGYTYGAYSSFAANKTFGSFMAYSSVQASVTKESVELFENIIKNYGENYTEEDLMITKYSLKRKATSQYETLSDLIDVLMEIATMDLPYDFVNREQEIVDNITFDEIKEIIRKHLNFNDMQFVIVGNEDVAKVVE